MMRFEDALQCVLDAAPLMATEEVDLHSSLGRVLAQRVCADLDHPPFRKSAMDGYACRRADVSQSLTVVAVIAAGVEPDCRIEVGHCAKIMTGAMVPTGADMVVPVEYTSLTDDGRMLVDRSVEIDDNIMMQGENVRRGSVLLDAGVRLKPEHIAILATVGCAHPAVYRRPRVGIIATGDELVEPDETPSVSRIRNSNSSQLWAQVLTAGAEPVYYGIARDSDDETGRLIRQAMQENDLILLSGGISMGDYDLVPGILQENGFRFLVEKVAIKPGKPVRFAVGDNCFCFGLPGNPVSTFTIYELLVRPFLSKMTGAVERDLEPRLPLAVDVQRRADDRLAWIPVRIENNQVLPLRYMGSGHVDALINADGMIPIPIGVRVLEKGTVVRVRPI
jgi:molybdopterin molybdotransferase